MAIFTSYQPQARNTKFSLTNMQTTYRRIRIPFECPLLAPGPDINWFSFSSVQTKITLSKLQSNIKPTKNIISLLNHSRYIVVHQFLLAFVPRPS